MRVPLRLRACAWVLSGVPALCGVNGLLGGMIVSSPVSSRGVVSPSAGVISSSEVASFPSRFDLKFFNFIPSFDVARLPQSGYPSFFRVSEVSWVASHVLRPFSSLLLWHTLCGLFQLLKV